MSWYILRGTLGFGDEPNEENPLSHFSTDMRWEIGYDRQWFTFWARLLDEDPDEELPREERAQAVFEVGTAPYECPTVEALNRELDAMTMSVPPALAAALRDEQRRHLAGELGESREAVEQRRRVVRQVVFVEFLKNEIRPVVGGTPERESTERWPGRLEQLFVYSPGDLAHEPGQADRGPTR